MVTTTIPIARNAFVESIRQPIVLLLVLASGMLQVFNTWNTGFSMGLSDSGEVSGDNKLLLDVGLATIFVIGALLAGFVATAVMSREIENKTVLTVVSKPVSRSWLVFGLFLGVSGAIIAATIVMLVFLLMAIRHEVMSTAADDVDAPVLVFSLGAVGIALALAAWTNFFYGWNFSQTALLLLVPLSVVAYIGVLLIDKHWKLQAPTNDLKPQIMLACMCLGLAVLVLTAVATAASTRLGQVATILICVGVFVASLLSNFFVGKHVFNNEIIGQIREARPEDRTTDRFDEPGRTYNIVLQQAPRERIRPGDPFYYSASPNGFPMENQAAPRFTGPTDDPVNIRRDEPGIVVTQVLGTSADEFTVRQIGRDQAVAITRPPRQGDYVFLTPTRINYAALAAWGVVPNLHFFWMLDAITQNRAIPPGYVGMLALYAACHIAAFLALAVMLFEERDVG